MGARVRQKRSSIRVAGLRSAVVLGLGLIGIAQALQGQEQRPTPRPSSLSEFAKKTRLKRPPSGSEGTTSKLAESQTRRSDEIGRGGEPEAPEAVASTTPEIANDVSRDEAHRLLRADEALLDALEEELKLLNNSLGKLWDEFYSEEDRDRRSEVCGPALGAKLVQVAAHRRATESQREKVKVSRERATRLGAVPRVVRESER